jgi:crossover junction endodeoxyribonuclease RuvC
MKILGIDPGLQYTGWGIVESKDNQLHFIKCGSIKTDLSLPMSGRLNQIYEGLEVAIEEHKPEEAAIEEIFMNNNPASAIKLGCARGVAMVVPARAGIPVAEYAANLIKKSVVGTGHATKDQMEMMVRTLVPTVGRSITADEADAIAVAICHAHHAATRSRFSTILSGAKR